MKSFLKTLERLVDIIDGEMQQPIVKVLTGEVFTHDATSHSHGYSNQEPSIPQAASHALPTTNPTREPRQTDNNIVCPPRLQPAGAHKK